MHKHYFSNQLRTCTHGIADTGNGFKKFIETSQRQACWETPQQNCVAERMNIILVDTVCSILSDVKFDGITAKFRIFQLKHFSIAGLAA